MDVHLSKERLTGYTVLSVIIAVIFLVFAVFLGLTTSVEADFSFAGIVILFRNNPVFWLILVFAALLPLTVMWITRKLNEQLLEKQDIIDQEQARIDQVNDFARQLTQDNLDVDFVFSGENDSLGESLINLRNTLKSNSDNNLKLRKEEEERNWIAEGSSHFSEILRNYIHEPEQLSFNVIKDLTKYVNAIQGGFYMLEDSDSSSRYFNLVSFFAYDRRKFTDQKIKWGDGLIGTCAMEQKTIHLKSIPESYITVTSGLGEANPDSLLIVPMLYEGQIYGVLEFASFGKFEPNHLALIEQTAESVATTLSAIKTNIKTARLLEESKAQTQSLTSHEEEMRQNMEELQATQEESTRQSHRLIVLEDTLNQNLIRAEFDPEGRLITANNLFYSKFEYSNDHKIEGKQLSELICVENRGWFKQIWNDLLHENKPYKGYIQHITRTGKDLWTIASLSITRNEDATIERIMLLAIDTSEERDQLMKHEAIVELVNDTGIKLELDINGNLLDCNKNFIELFKLSQKDIKSLVVFDIINPIELEAFNRQWDSIIKGNGFTGILRGKTSGGDEVLLNGAFSITNNMSHEIERIIFVGVDITHEKHLEAELNKALETIKKQEKLIKDSEKEMANRLRETKSELHSQFKEIEKVKNINEKILEESPDAIITTSQDNHIVFFNKAAELLWQMDRKDLLEQDISILFPESLTEKDELLGSFTRPGDHKITGKRKKSTIIDKNGKEKSVLILLTKARVDNENAYMAFIQHTEK
jgi:PAS domain S-box-containing protein